MTRDARPKDDASSGSSPDDSKRGGGFRQWIETWAHCGQTLGIFVFMGRAVARLQLCTLMLRSVWLPVALTFWWLVALLRPSSARCSDEKAPHFSTKQFLRPECRSGLSGHMVALCIRYARKYSIDSVFCDLLRQQVKREAGSRSGNSIVFLAVPEGATSGKPAAGSLSSVGTLSLIESLSLIIGVELLSSDLHVDDAPLGGDKACSSSKLPAAVHRTVAVMLPNSIYFPSVWLGVSKSSEVLSAVSATTAADGVASPRGQSCSAALLNTSISNNAMFVRSIASSGAQMVIVDASYVGLLFADDHHHASSSSSDVGGKAATRRASTSRPVVSVPPSIKKILLWNDAPVLLCGGGYQAANTPLIGELPCGITTAQLQAIAAYNDDVCTAPRHKYRLFADEGEELTSLWLSNLTVHSLYPSVVVNQATLEHHRQAGSGNGSNGNTALSAAAHASPSRASLHESDDDSDRASSTGKSGGRSAKKQQAKKRNNSNQAHSLQSSTSSGGKALRSPSTSRGSERSPPSSHGSTAATGSFHTPNMRSANVGTPQYPGQAASASGASSWGRVISPIQISANFPAAVLANLPFAYADLVLEHVGIVPTLAANAKLSWSRLWSTYRALSFSYRPTDPILKIFTSGTTGLPKAAKFTHLRFHMGVLLAGQVDVVGRTRRLFIDADRFDDATRVLTTYNALPMYHSAGGVFCTSHLICAMKIQLARPVLKDGTVPSARMVVRKKFSASNYAAELQHYRVHIVQYIGEVLRYAVKATTDKPTSSDSSWRVPVALGNGLRRDVWEDVLRVLPIHSLVEFYASTEGNVGMINIFDEPFAIGHLPVLPWPVQRFSPVFWPIFPMKLVDYDPDAAMPRRYEGNLCRMSNIGDVGELLGKVPRAGGFDPIGLRRFDGYHDPNETKKKLVTNVLKAGDVYFRSGDLLRIDARGFVSFVDRIGDTFRWKGENVSTLEVSNALNGVASKSSAIAIHDAVVYGVGVPGREGKAGMAKFSLIHQRANPRRGGTAAVKAREDIAAEQAFLRDELYSKLSSKTSTTSLPAYAIPLFLRVETAPTTGGSAGSHGADEADGEAMTGTFKHRPVLLATESYYAAIPRVAQALMGGLPPQLHTAFGDGPAPASSRYYVLLPSRMVTACAPPGAIASQWAYMPLNDELLEKRVGTMFEHSGW